MDIDLPDSRRLDDLWRAKLDEPKRRYAEGSRVQCSRVLRVFTDLG
jgi:hypothetical protein